MRFLQVSLATDALIQSNKMCFQYSAHLSISQCCLLLAISYLNSLPQTDNPNMLCMFIHANGENLAWQGFYPKSTIIYAQYVT